MPAPNQYQRLYDDAARAAVPLDVVLELTQRCNFRCRHCYIPDFGAPDLIPTETVFRLLEQLAELGTLRLALTGGEVLLRGDWLQIAKRARALGFAVRVLTNGSLVDDAVADALAQLCVGVDVSLHSADAGAFETFTRAPGGFGRTLRAIELLRARDVDVLLKVPITVHNYRSLDAIHALAASLGAECLSYPAILPAKDGGRAPLAQRVPESALLPYYAGPNSHCPLPEPAPGDGADDAPLCAAGTRLACVTSCGDVVPCVALPLVAGNVLERSFREIWESSPVMRRLRDIRRADLKTCDACAKLAYCGRCHAQALGEEGDLLGPSSWACDHAAALEEAARRRTT